MIINIILAALIGLFAVIGLIVGLVKGFTKVNTWANEYVFAAIISILLGALLKKTLPDAKIAGIIVIVAAAALILGFIGLSKLVKFLINRGFEKRENNMEPYGGLGVFNRICGGLTLALKGAVMAMIIGVSVLTVFELSQLSTLLGLEFVGEFYSGGFWQFLQPHIFDFAIVGIMFLAIRHGYTSGISSALWGLFVVFLIAGAGFMSYNMVFNTQSFEGAAQSLGNSIAELFGAIPQGMEEMPVIISKWILTAVIFVLVTAVVILVSIFVPRLLDNARFRGKAFYITDGILGGLVLTVIVVGGILFVGSFLQPIATLEFMQPFTKYFESSTVATWFYDNNILAAMGVNIFPLRDYLA